MVIRTDVGGIFLDIRNFFSKFFLGHRAGIGEVAVAFRPLAAGKIIAFVPPCVGNQAIKHFAAHTGRNAERVVFKQFATPAETLFLAVTVVQHNRPVHTVEGVGTRVAAVVFVP